MESKNANYISAINTALNYCGNYSEEKTEQLKELRELLKLCDIVQTTSLSNLRCMQAENEKYQCCIHELQKQVAILKAKNELTEKENESLKDIASTNNNGIYNLKGQIEAFKFCVEHGSYRGFR